MTGALGQNAPVDVRASMYEELMDDAVLYATRAAARGVERHGAMDSIPWQDEL
jgi:ribokinase